MSVASGTNLREFHKGTRMRDYRALVEHLFDVAMIICGASVASQIRFEHVAEDNFYMAFVAFSAAFSLALSPCFDAEASRARNALGLVSQVLLGWLVVQGCALV